jgi:hypothetical protein
VSPERGTLDAESCSWLWICDLAASQTIDPAARLFADNLFRAAAADPDSTKNLKPMPTHEQLLNGRRN